jgi:hypothetical protein
MIAIKMVIIINHYKYTELFLSLELLIDIIKLFT